MQLFMTIVLILLTLALIPIWISTSIEQSKRDKINRDSVEKIYQLDIQYYKDSRDYKGFLRAKLNYDKYWVKRHSFYPDDEKYEYKWETQDENK